MPTEVKWAISFLAGAALFWVGWKVYFVLVTLHVIVCLVLIAVILLQSGEAADLAGAFGGSGSQTAFGPRGAATFLSRATTWCAIDVYVHVDGAGREARAVGGSGSDRCWRKRSSPQPAAGKVRARRRLLMPSTGADDSRTGAAAASTTAAQPPPPKK